MQEPKIDRRVQRTEQQMRDALIALMLEKGYDAVTIQDILDRANMGRSTFYAHYRDKEELLLSGFQVLFDGFQKEFQQVASPNADPAQIGRQLSLFFFRHAASHRGLFKAMIGEKGGKIIQDHALKYLTQFIRDHLAAQMRQQKDFPVDIVAYFIASSYLSLLIWWLDHDLPYTAEQMDRFYQELVFPGIQKILEKHP